MLCIPPSLWLASRLAAPDCMQHETGGASVRSMFYLLDCSHLAENMCSLESLALLKGQAWQFAAGEDASCENSNVRATYMKALKAISVQCIHRGRLVRSHWNTVTSPLVFIGHNVLLWTFNTVLFLWKIFPLLARWHLLIPWRMADIYYWAWKGCVQLDNGKLQASTFLRLYPFSFSESQRRASLLFCPSQRGTSSIIKKAFGSVLLMPAALSPQSCVCTQRHGWEREFEICM